MTTEAADLAALAHLLADQTRAAMCLALLDGRAWTATELAAHAGVAKSTASEHLDRLIGGGLLAEERQGRHRYVRLADADVAHLIEDLSAHLEPRRAPVRGLRQATASAAMQRARTCYDHLAGALGVADRGGRDRRGGAAPARAVAAAHRPRVPGLDRAPAAPGRGRRRAAVRPVRGAALVGADRHDPGREGHPGGAGGAAGAAGHRLAFARGG
jgi:DNA-binding transcriptional ArsR family regulator